MPAPVGSKPAWTTPAAPAWTGVPAWAARSTPVCICRPGQNGSNGSRTKVVQPNGSVSTAPGTMAASGTRCSTGTRDAATLAANSATSPMAMMRTKPISSSSGDRVLQRVEAGLESRLQLVGDLFRSTHRTRHLEHDQQSRQSKDVVDRCVAITLEREADRQHEQLNRLHQQVRHEQRAPLLGDVVRFRQREEEAGKRSGDGEDDEDRVPNEVRDSEDVVADD